MKKVLMVGILSLSMFVGCGDGDSCCDGPVPTTQVVSSPSQSLASGSVSQEVLPDVYNLEMYCPCEERVIPGSTITINDNGYVWDYSDVVKDLQEQYPEVEKLWRIEGSDVWMSDLELEQYLRGV